MRAPRAHRLAVTLSVVSPLTLFLGLIVLLLFIVLGLYNGLIARRNGARNAFASLDANLQKRYDLIPNLIATVKGYMTHERDTLEALTRLRERGNRVQNEGASAQLIGQIMARAEAYPDLKASANFLHLQRTLTEIEEQISASRRAFNASVADYNNAIETFPGTLLASSFGFTRRDFYQSEEAARVAPQVGSFDN